MAVLLVEILLLLHTFGSIIPVNSPVLGEGVVARQAVIAGPVGIIADIEAPFSFFRCLVGDGFLRCCERGREDVHRRIEDVRPVPVIIQDISGGFILPTFFVGALCAFEARIIQVHKLEKPGVNQGISPGCGGRLGHFRSEIGVPGFEFLRAFSRACGDCKANQYQCYLSHYVVVIV